MIKVRTAINLITVLRDIDERKIVFGVIKEYCTAAIPARAPGWIQIKCHSPPP